MLKTEMIKKIEVSIVNDTYTTTISTEIIKHEHVESVINYITYNAPCIVEMEGEEDIDDPRLFNFVVANNKKYIGEFKSLLITELNTIKERIDNINSKIYKNTIMELYQEYDCDTNIDDLYYAYEFNYVLLKRISRKVISMKITTDTTGVSANITLKDIKYRSTLYYTNRYSYKLLKYLDDKEYNLNYYDLDIMELYNYLKDNDHIPTTEIGVYIFRHGLKIIDAIPDVLYAFYIRDVEILVGDKYLSGREVLSCILIEYLIHDHCKENKNTYVDYIIGV